MCPKKEDDHEQQRERADRQERFQTEFYIVEIDSHLSFRAAIDEACEEDGARKQPLGAAISGRERERRDVGLIGRRHASAQSAANQSATL
jgi:hypothetical protein